MMATSRSWRGRTLSPWWRRALAVSIDSFAIFIVIYVAFPDVVSDYTAGGDSLLSWVAITEADDLPYMLLYAALSFIYFVPVMIAWNGKTLGKALLSIRVVREDDRRLGVVAIVVRQVLLQAVVMNVLYPFILLDYLWPLRDPERRAVHDFVARTRVVCDLSGLLARGK